MKLFIPNNLYSISIAELLLKNSKHEISFLQSSLISEKISKEINSIGLIPTTDLIKKSNLFVSKSFGISFEGSLCNSYIYFNSNEKNIKEFYTLGDVSSVDVMLAKILFDEIYESTIDLKISSDISFIKSKNSLLIGDDNFINERYSKGLSFSEEFVDAFSVPFVNYVFASLSSNNIDKLNNDFDGANDSVYDIIEMNNFGKDFSQLTRDYIQENISSFIFNLKEEDVEGIKFILQLPFLKGIINDLIELKLI